MAFAIDTLRFAAALVTPLVHLPAEEFIDPALLVASNAVVAFAALRIARLPERPLVLALLAGATLVALQPLSLLAAAAAHLLLGWVLIQRGRTPAYRGFLLAGAIAALHGLHFLLTPIWPDTAGWQFTRLALGGSLYVATAISLLFAALRAQTLTAQAERSRFQLVFESANDLLVLFRVAADGRLFPQYMNPSALAFFARAFPEIDPASWLTQDVETSFRGPARLTTEQIRDALAPHREVLRTGRPVSSDASLHTGSGERLSRRFTIHPIREDGGRITHLFYHGVDITELRRAEERFETAFRVSPVPMAITTESDGHCLEANDAWLAIHGLRREQAIGRTSLELGLWPFPQDRERMRREIEERGSVDGLEASFRFAGGRVARCRISAERIRWSGQNAIIAAVQEITDAGDARRQAQETGQQFDRLFEHSPAALSIVRLRDNRRLQANAAFLRFFGLPRDAMTGAQAIDGSVFWVDAAERASVFAMLARDGHVRDQIVQLRGSDGQPRDALVAIDRIRWEGEDCIITSTHDVTEIRRATAEIQRLAEQHAALFEISPVPLSVVRARDGVRVRANAAWLAFSGSSREESVGKPAREHGIWVDPDVRDEMIATARREGRATRRLVRMIGAGGATRTVQVSMESIVWDREPCLLSAILDVTELEHARAEALAARVRLEAILEQSPVGISISSLADGRYRYVNPAWSRTYGIERDKALGMDSVQSGFWPSHAERLASYGPLRERGREVHVPRSFRHPDGRVAHVLLSAQLLDFDGEPCVLALTQDVTARELAQEAARLSGERFAKLFEISPVPLVIGRRSDGEYLAANSAWLDLHGFRREDLHGATSVSLGVWPSTEDRDRVIELLARDGEVRALPVRFRAKSGEVIDALYYAAPIDWQGEPAVLAAPQDITALKRAAEEIRRLNESLEQRVRDRTAELEHALREIESFSYTVSHDLRAPLRHVSAFAELLQARDSVRVDREAVNYATRLSGAARRMSGMIDSLLEYSRLGRKPIARSQVNLAAETEQVIAELGAQAAGRRVQWDVGPLPVVGGDATLLRLLLQNLLDNALKYTRPREEARIEVGARRDAGRWIVHVRDNGVGFDMQHADKLFGVFQRLHSESEFEGTGVGLAHAARIVERHGGRIWCEASPGKGATFFFSLPA